MSSPNFIFFPIDKMRVYAYYIIMTKRLNITMPDKLYEKVAKEAKKRERSISGLIRLALKKIGIKEGKK